MKKLSETYKELGIAFAFPIEILNENGKQTYCEDSDGFWCRCEYDKDVNSTYFENSDGFWARYEYDENGKETYCEDNNGFWERREYDKDGNSTYYETNDGFWERYEYDEKGNRTYFENSDGDKHGTKRGSCSGKVIEIDGKKYKLTEL